MDEPRKLTTYPVPGPRVEGEAVAPRMPSSVVQDEINYCAHKLDRTFRDEVDLRTYLYICQDDEVDLRTYLYICQDWRDFQSRLARLTAEVERLTKEKAALHAIATEAVDCFEACHNFDGDPEEVGGWDGQIAKLRAALSLPTPAPEAKDGE